MSAISFKLGVVAQPSQHKFCHKESVVRTWCSYNRFYGSYCKYTICPLTLACIITSHDLLSENPSFAGPSVNLSLFCKKTFERRSATQKQMLLKGPIKGIIYAYS